MQDLHDAEIYAETGGRVNELAYRCMLYKIGSLLLWDNLKEKYECAVKKLRV